MSKVSVELNDVKLNIFKKGNFVVSNNRNIVVLVTSDNVVGGAFSGVYIYDKNNECNVGGWFNNFRSDGFNGLFEGKIIIE